MSRTLVRSPRPVGVAIVVAALLGASEAPVDAAELLLKQVRLVDPIARTDAWGSVLLRDADVVERGDREGAALHALAPGARVVDLEGSWLLPALVDLRVHAGENRSPGHRDRLGASGTARVLAASGVSLYADVYLGEEGRRWRRERGDGPGLSARPRIAGPVITAPGGRGSDHPGAHIVFTSEQAEALLDSLARQQPAVDLVTVVADRRPPHRPLPPATLQTLLAAARERGLKSVVEVGTWEDVTAALAAGAEVLCHLPPEPLPADVASRIGRARPLWIPTLAVALDFRLLIQDEQLRASPLLLRAAPEPLIADYGMVRVPGSRLAEGRQMQRTLTDNVTALRDLGVRWRAGSDSGSIGTFQGWTLLRELQWWAVMGIPTWEILAAVTVESAAMLGERRGFEPGARADFLVLPRSPVEDLQVLTQPSALVLGGELADPAGLFDAVLREVVTQGGDGPIEGLGRGVLFLVLIVVFGALWGLRTLVRRAVRDA